MRWPWRRRDHESPEPDEQGLDEAHEALENALNMWPEVNRVAEHMRGIRRRNHLAEITERALRGTR